MAVAPKHQKPRLVVPKISSVERTSGAPVVVIQGINGEKIKLPSTPVTQLDEATKERLVTALAAVI